MRDDYSVAHYGFLPALEHPPRLCLVDHRDFKPDEAYSHDEAPSEAPYTGEPGRGMTPGTPEGRMYGACWAAGGR